MRRVRFSHKADNLTLLRRTNISVGGSVAYILQTSFSLAIRSSVACATSTA